MLYHIHTYIHIGGRYRGPKETWLLLNLKPLLLLCGQITFLWGDGKKSLVWFTVATHLSIPHCSGGVNGGNVICYCSIITRAISIVLY